MLRWSIVLCLLLAVPPVPVAAQSAGTVRIIEGPTPIPNGKCRSPRDLTLLNDRVAFSFAVETARPWGNPAGAILDGGLVADGVVGKDRLSFVDFLPDGWKPWPHVRHEIRILQNGPERAVLEVSRDFRGNPLVTTWTLEAGSSKLQVETVLRNRSDKPLVDLISGYSFCTKDGDSFVPETVSEISWAAGYGPDWSGGLEFPGADQVTGGRSWKDLYRTTTVAEGGEVRFAATYSLCPGPDISGLVASAARRAGRATGLVSGTVRTAAGSPVALPYIIVRNEEGKVVGWAAGGASATGAERSPACRDGATDCAPLDSVVGDGSFSFELPVGRWQLQAAAVDHRSPPSREAVVVAGSHQTVDFDGLEPPGMVRLHVRGQSGEIDGIDARIVRVGTPPPVRHVERFVTYTSPDARGEALIPCPPGEHEFLVSHGGGFLASPASIRLEVPPGGTAEATVLLDLDERPATRGWYCADLHHHSDHADGKTSPEELVLSQSAAGLDYVFVSDHDFVGNHEAIERIARERRLPFIPGIEVSPSFGHFNLFPLPVGADPGIDSSNTTPRAIFEAARRLGALVQANHPMDSGNAYLRSHLLGDLPGGFSLDFDLIEMNADDEFDSSDREALDQAFGFWDAGRTFWLSGGSDTHDVKIMESDEVSGRTRTCVHVEADEPQPAGAPLSTPSAQAFASALKAGRAVATFGPMVYPGFEPGSAVPRDADGKLRLPLEAFAAWGLAEVRVRSSGGVVWSSRLEGCPRSTEVSPELLPDGSAWYLVEVVDCQGNPAFVNPVHAALPDAP